MTVLFDAGRFGGYDLAQGTAHPIEEIVSDLDRRGVAGALVGSYRALYQDMLEGNREAASWAARYPGRVWALAIVHPAFYGSSPRALIRWIREELRCSAVALFSSPAYYPVDWVGPAVRSIGEAAAEADIPLQAGITNERELGEVARAWGDLPVTVMVRWMGGHRYRALAHEIVVAERHPRFVFDVSNMCSTGMIAHAASTIGASRLFFSSGAPYSLAGPAHAVLETAALSRSDVAAIASKTACRALGISGLAIHPSTGSRIGPLERVLSAPKIDVHWHPDHWNLGEPALEDAQQTETFDRFNYQAVVGSSIMALNGDLARGNAAVGRWTLHERRRFGLIAIDPLRQRESLDQIARHREDPRFVGVKTIQDALGLTLDDDAYKPLLVEAERSDLPVLCHFPGVERAAASHPGVRFVVAHATWRRARTCFGAANVVFDVSTSHANAHETRLDLLLGAVGPRRLLFGSDGQLISPAWSLAKFASLGIDDAALDLVLRDNARRVFSRIVL